MKTLAKLVYWLRDPYCQDCGKRVASDDMGYILGKRCLYHYWRWSRQK